MAWTVHKRQMTIIPGPHGGSLYVDYEFSLTDFVTYVERFARVPRSRWDALMARAQHIVSWWRAHREGKFPFNKDDFAELQALGLPVEAVVADAQRETDTLRR